MKNIFWIGMAILLCSACSKKDDLAPQSPSQTNIGKGTLYFDWAGTIYTIDLHTLKAAIVIQGTTSVYGWDISTDGEKMLISSELTGDVDANLYTYARLSDSRIVAQFAYYPSEGDLTNGFISPDESMIAVQPTFDDGIVIMDTVGQMLHHLTGFANKSFSYGDQVAWMPDGSLVFTLENSIYRTNTTFTQAHLIKQLSFTSWGDLAVSPDGSKIALKGGNHIWMIDSDGSQLVQVTESDAEEAMPVFSPDGKYLVVGTDYHVTGPFGSLWYLAIIPADGQKYNVDEGMDERVVFIPDVAEEDDYHSGYQPASGNVEWR